jgi:mRNA interferase MazF
MSHESEDFDSWNIIKKTTDKRIVKTKIRAGEVRWCRFGVNVGNETIGKGDTFRRPVLILKKFSGDVFLGLPLTTKAHTGDWYYSITHEGVGRSIILNQARVLDKKRLEEKLFEISETELERVKQCYCELILKP